MKISAANVLSKRLKPLCPRDNHLMKYRARRSRANTEDQPSFHCGYQGCSVRYNANDGYYMLIGAPDRSYAVAEPGINTLKCPRHGEWLVIPQRGLVGAVASKAATMLPYKRNICNYLTSIWIPGIGS